MGMDVHGINPKQNKTIDKFPVLVKYKKMVEEDSENGFQKKWKELDADHNLREQYWKEEDEYDKANPGHYFRNNVWWWRPLWDYCYQVADDIIDEETYESGHSNSGAGLDADGAKALGNRLMQLIADCSVIKHEEEDKQRRDNLPEDDCRICENNNRGNNKKKDCTRCNQTGKTENFNKHYPFDSRNVEEFAHFCIQSGGFEIC